MICPRCGRAQPPEAPAGVFCAHCGQFLVATKWVAIPPQPPEGLRPPAPRRPRYSGPPRYQSPPSWGFPALGWAAKKAESSTSSSPARSAAAHAALLVPLLRGLAVLAVVAAAAEIWRYVLLLDSRDSALDAGQVAASDALVQTASWVCTLMAIVVGAYLLIWLLRVRAAAAEHAKVAPARGQWSTLLGWLVPGINLAVPGSVLAEIEHTALDRPATERPKPSRLLLLWWALWAGNVIFGVLAVVWLFRDSVQAKADGVVLHALLDLLAAATAIVTAKVVSWLTALVNPPRPVSLRTVVKVREAASTNEKSTDRKSTGSKSTEGKLTDGEPTDAIGGLAHRLKAARTTVFPR